MIERSGFQEIVEYFDGDEMAATVFSNKYAIRDGDLIEHPDELIDRVAKAVASVEKDSDKWYRKFKEVMTKFKYFVPAGRILYGAGRENVKVSLFNCMYLPIEEDSLEGILDTAKKLARAYSRGFGVGLDISILRYNGAPVNNAAEKSTGSVSFMDLYSIVTGIVGQNQRRGALIITIDSSHPDIFDFLDKKAIPDMHTKELIRDFEYAGFSKEMIEQIAKVLVRHQVRYANISVKIDDELMKAVKEDGYYILRFGDYKKKIKARKLFRQLAQRAWESAEPGVIFWNTAQKFSNSDVYGDKFRVGGLNPCAEQILPPYGVCNLGSINLSSFVKKPFTDEAYLDKENLKEVIEVAVRFLDDVNDLALKLGTIPFKETEYLVKNERRIGLGIMGLADMLIKMGYKYDAQEARDFIAEVMKFFRDSAYEASIELAKEKGAFPVFDPDRHLKSKFIQTLPEKIRRDIYDYGIRNMAILSVAPTGSISILARTSSGIEPLFFLEYERYSPSLGKVFKTEHPLVAEYRKLCPDKELPDTFVVAHQIDPEDRVRMQAVIGKYVDAAMSSTVNLPESATVEDVEKIYMLAYDLGLKGITVYREGSRAPIVAKKKEEKKQEETGLKLRKTKRKRPAVLSGKTYKIKYKNNNYYVTINSDDGKPLEVFAQSSDMTEQEWWGALSRVISAVLRRVAADEDVMFLSNQLLKIKEVQGTGSFYKGEYIPSKPGIVGLALKWFLEGKDPDEKPKVDVSPVIGPTLQLDKKALKQVVGELDLNKAKVCPVCGNRTLITGEEAKAFGCSSFCVSCGYSKCD